MATETSAAEGGAPHVPATDLPSVEAGAPEASMPRLEGVPDDERSDPSAAGFAQASRRSGSMAAPDGARGGGAVAGDKAGGVVAGARGGGVVDGALSAASVHADRRAHRRVVWAIARRDLLAMLYGPSIYVVVALGMLAALPVMASHLDAIERNRVLILADAFTLPFFVAATLAMLFLAFASVATIARERDQGTLEVLFYGPVSVGAYVLAKHLAQILAFVPIVGALGLLLLAYSGMTGLRLPAAFGLELLLSLCTAAAVAALGICISALARGVRAGVGLLLGLALLFLAIIGTDDVLSALPVRDNVSPLLFARTIAHWLSTAVSYVSPFGLFQAGIDALVQQDPVGYLGAVALSLLHCALLLTAAARLLERRGVRR